MKWKQIAGAAALAMMSSAALAQGISTQTTVQTAPVQLAPAPMAPAVTTGPAGSVSQTRTERSVDSNGVEVNKTQSFDKTQSYSSGDGTLNATTRTTNSAEVKTLVPPPVSTTTRTTTTIEK